MIQDTRYKIFYLSFHVYNYTHLGRFTHIHTYIFTHSLIHTYEKKCDTKNVIHTWSALIHPLPCVQTIITEPNTMHSNIICSQRKVMLYSYTLTLAYTLQK